MWDISRGMPDESIKLLFTALGGAAFGAIITGLFTSFNAWRTDVRDTTKWHRNQKMDAYVDFLEDIQKFIHAFSRYHEQGPVYLKDAKQAGKSMRNEKLLVVASTEVRQAQRELGVAVAVARSFLDRIPPTATGPDPRLWHLSHELATKRDAFLMAIQQDLKLPVGDPILREDPSKRPPAPEEVVTQPE